MLSTSPAPSPVRGGSNDGGSGSENQAIETEGITLLESQHFCSAIDSRHARTAPHRHIELLSKGVGTLYGELVVIQTLGIAGR